MSTLRIFAQCLNAASLQCSFSTVIDYTIVKGRLRGLRQWTAQQLNSMEVCRVHDTQENGCFCPTNSGLSTAVQINELKEILTSSILDQMVLWPEFQHMSRPDQRVNVQFVPLYKQ
jgi:hypothetical protein